MLNTQSDQLTGLPRAADPSRSGSLRVMDANMLGSVELRMQGRRTGSGRSPMPVNTIFFAISYPKPRSPTSNTRDERILE